MNTEEVHANHHRLIDERRRLWLATPKRESFRRRQRAKQAWWALTSHVRSHHAEAMRAARLNPSSPFLRMTYEQVAALHEKSHRPEPE